MGFRISLLVPLCLCFATIASAQEYKKFQSASMTISYPAGWEAAKNEPPVEFFISSPYEAKDDAFMENVNLVTEPTTMNLATYVSTNKENMVKLLNAKIALEGNTKLGNIQAMYIVYDFVYGERPIKSVAYFFLHKGNAYVLTGSALPATYDRYQPIFAKIAGSIVMK